MVTQHSAYIHHPWMRSPLSDKILIVSVASIVRPVRPLSVTVMDLPCPEEVPPRSIYHPTIFISVGSTFVSASASLSRMRYVSANHTVASLSFETSWG